MLPTICGFLLLLGAAEGNENPPEKGTAIRVECHGKLRTGMVAIGGETTGTEITFEGIKWELNLSNAADKAIAEQNNKKPVTAVGTLRQVKSTERGVRWIVDVEKLTPRDEAKQKPGANMTLTGLIKKSSGEPAGRIVEVNDITWPLDFDGNTALEGKADSLLDKPAALSGSLQKDKDCGPEAKVRLRVQKLDPATPQTAKK